MLKIWGLKIKGLQIYQSSNFENDWTLTGIEPGPTDFEWGRGRAADFFLRPPTLKAGSFEAL